jgi:hypothetical protein
VSFALEVFAVLIPDDVTGAWAAGLAGEGLIVHPHPQFDFHRWRGGWVSFKCSARNAGYPRAAFAAGFELDIDADLAPAGLATNAPDDARELIEQSKAIFHLSTPSARTVGDLRLQSLGAAVLADICGGAVYDPQRDEFFRGAAALVNARREAESFESSAEAESWALEPFRGWNGAR